MQKSVWAHWQVAWRLANVDIRVSYRQSMLGPFWQSITLFAQVVVISVLMSSAFREPFLEYFLHVASGLVVWNLISNVVGQSAQVLYANSSILKSTTVGPEVLVLRTLLRVVLGSLQNFVVVVITAVFVAEISVENVTTFVGGFFIMMVFLWHLGLISSVLGARFRDFSGAVNGILLIGFYLTPIIWQEQQISDRFGNWLFLLNPFGYPFDWLRLPLEGANVPGYRLLLTPLVVGLLVVFTHAVIRKKLYRVVFWV